METMRQPLKRVCSDTAIGSPSKKRFGSAEEVENRDPALSEGAETVARSSWSSLLRLTEQEIKPDTPAISSVRSRIRRLQEIGMRDTFSDNGGEGCVFSSAEKEKDGLRRPDLVLEKDAESLSESGRVCLVLEDMDKNGAAEERLLPLAQSTLAPRRPLPTLEDNPSSLETESRMRKERQEELAMVCAAVDRSNPWRAQSMRQKKRRLAEQANEDLGSDKRRRRVRTGRGQVKMRPLSDAQSDSSDLEAAELSLDDSDESLNFSEERCVSSLEVRLRGTCGSGSLPPEEPPCLCDSVDEGKPVEGSPVDNGDQRRVTMNSSEIIDRIFEGVLDVSEVSEDLELDLPPVSILSPLTKSVDLQAAISPLGSVVSSLPELLEEERIVTSAEQENPYSVDTYRTLRKTLQKDPNSQLSTPTASHSLKKLPAESGQGDMRERIKLLNKEVSSLQRIIEQSCCALSCCVDVEHGKGTRQEAEAERLLLVSTEKKDALLKDLNQLREHSGSSESCPPGKLKPCRASVTVSNIELPLKVDYVCSTICDSGIPSHYFLILLRYGSHDVIATPLATAADAQTGITILFPTTVTLNDADADFRIEIEVYSLAQNGSGLTADKRKSLKPKITPKKLLSSRKPSLNSPVCSPAANGTIKSSSFLLVGSLTLSLDSLGKFKFPLEKIPFLSPLEGNLYVKISCQSHSDIQRNGFLTMFEDVSGLGAWHRRWFVLSSNVLAFWHYPDQEAFKDPLGRINLVNCTSASIEAVTRETCARPHTFELSTMRPQQEDDTDTLVTCCRNTLCFTKNWLSADTKEDKDQWMDCLNQVLLDLRAWGVNPVKVTPS